MNKRKIFFIIFIVFFVLIVGFYYTQVIQRPKISSRLSSRAQEFVKEQQFSGDSALKFINLTGPVGEDTRNKRIGRKDCYSFIIPYRVTVSRFEDSSGNSCTARFSFDKPRGSIFAYIYKKPVSSWDDVSGVSFRRKHPEEYEEKVKKIGDKTFLMFRLKSDIYEENVFYYISDYFFVFNFITKTNENLDKDLEGMLKTLEFQY